MFLYFLDFRFTEELTGTFCPPKCYNYDPKERYKIPDTITKDGLKVDKMYLCIIITLVNFFFFHIDNAQDKLLLWKDM